MKVEQIRDILDWTRDYHRQMAQCYEHCADRSDSTRIKMLLEYISDHQQKLAEAIAEYETDADLGLLNTWFIEYFHKHPMLHDALCQAELFKLDTQQIVEKTIESHEHLIALYRHLAGRAETERTKALFDNLVELEQHEQMRMVRDSGSFEDL